MRGAKSIYKNGSRGIATTKLKFFFYNAYIRVGQDKLRLGDLKRVSTQQGQGPAGLELLAGARKNIPSYRCNFRVDGNPMEPIKIYPGGEYRQTVNCTKSFINISFVSCLKALCPVLLDWLVHTCSDQTFQRLVLINIRVNFVIRINLYFYLL